AWFHLGKFSKQTNTKYTFKKPGNGLYVFMLEGEANVGGQALAKRDGYGIWDANEIEISAMANTRLLLMEVPMNL
ncbi:MAG: hypothetical protein RLZZ337_175, partial [Bacteroidota bacterium]